MPGGAAQEGPSGGAEQSEPLELGPALGRLSEPDLPRGEARALLVRVAALLTVRARGVGAAAVASGRWLGEVLIEAAPHVPVRDEATLSAHHHGLHGEALADAVVRNATAATTAVGAAAGTLAAAQWFVAPVLVAVPIEIVVETLAVAVVELKLLAELHNVYGVPVPGSGTQRALGLAVGWAQRRGVNPLHPWALSAAMLAASRASVSRRMMGRFARNLGGLAPLMVGAIYGARSNRNQTRSFAGAVRQDLRVQRATRQVSGPSWPSAGR